MFTRRIHCSVLAFLIAAGGAAKGMAAEPLAGTQALVMEGDRSEQMVRGIGRFLDRQLEQSASGRPAFWRRDDSSAAAYTRSVGTNRDRFGKMIGAVDPRRTEFDLELVGTTTSPAKIAETDRFTAYRVRWPVFETVYAEGLLLQPKGAVTARVVALPDADQLPEAIAGLAPGVSPEQQYARRLAESGCVVIVPALVDRAKDYSGNPAISRRTALTHREWIYRQAFELGRHVIGYEAQQVRSAVDWLARQGAEKSSIGLVGYGEGGLLALYTAAVDTRIDATLVSGYFAPREKLWQEPVYRNVFGLLREFGDAEIASLIAPRMLLIDPAIAPAKVGVSPTPGEIVTPSLEAVQAEVNRARELAGRQGAGIQLLPAGPAAAPVPAANLAKFLGALGAKLATAGAVPAPVPGDFAARQERLVRQLERHTQRLLQLAATTREEFLWRKVAPATPDAWQTAMQPHRKIFGDDLIGRFPRDQKALNPRARQIYDRPTWTGHEVVLDVLPDVFAWGYLLLPKDLKPGEKRPVVVTQHGLEGLPEHLLDEDRASRNYSIYKAFAARLVERGFIVFVPHNPYRGGNTFRQLQRRANPLGKTLYAIMVAQHEAVLDWLETQSFVDAKRIAFYGLSYGGKTALRIPALVERYCLSICSGDWNEWIWKNSSTDWPRTYMYTNDYEIFEFNLGMTFNYAEMAALIAPRPFMVERGHDDGTAIDEWAAFEYAKVRRLYDKLKISERTEMEYFDGPHTIHGVGTFQFLHRHLNWPERTPPAP